MASRSLNKVQLIGNLTRDPELKYTPAGTAVCTIGIATNRSWTTAEGTIKDDVQYHRVVAWQKLAELCGKILTKGKKVYVEGRITYRNYTGKDGQPRSITEIVMDDFILVGAPMGTGTGAATPEAKIHEEMSAPEPSMDDFPDQTPAEKPKKAKKTVSEDINPDDIPF